MCRFVESIKLKDGKFFRLKYHQERVNKTFQEFFPEEEPINVFSVLSELLLPADGTYKIRIVYDKDVISADFAAYVRREIKSLKLVETNIQSAPYKFEDRTAYNEAFSQKGDCDDILLVKNGLLTDASYCNVALFDGKKWMTPKTPLIYGTNRAELIDNGMIEEQDMKADSIKNYEKICLFNAMIEFGELTIDTSYNFV